MSTPNEIVKSLARRLHNQGASEEWLYLTLREAGLEALIAYGQEGCQRMQSVLAEYHERGESERPFVLGCKEWRKSWDAAVKKLEQG